MASQDAAVPLVALTIAGSDSSGGAGAQADLKTWTVMGLYGCSVFTALTAQATTGVTEVLTMEPQFVRAQIEAVVNDLPINVVKLGVLSRPDVIREVEDAITIHKLGPLVIDPVMVSKAGSPLIEDSAIAALSKLFTKADVVTPNRKEASRLTLKPCETINEGKTAAREIQERFGCEAVVVTGFPRKEEMVDIFFDGMRLVELPGKAGQAEATHGSGCTFSAALAAGLARGENYLAAAEAAKAFVTMAIKEAPNLGKGPSPVSHLALLGAS